MRGRHSALVPVLTGAARTVLESWQRTCKVSGLQARRGRLIVLVADGLPISHAAAQAGLTRRHAYRWLRRWQAEGLAGLQDRPRPTDLTRQREAKARKRRERMLCPI